MPRPVRVPVHLLLGALLVAGLFAPAVAAPPAQAHEGHEGAHVLVFSKTAAFRHSSIPDGIAAISQIGADHDITVEATEDASAFTADNLANYDAVVFLSTTGDVLNDAQQAAFEAYIESGGGYAGVHAASDTEYGWDWYGGLVGTYFSGHPDNQDATVHVADHTHPSTAGLPERWDRFDEWYNFQDNPRGDVHVLATLDESTYDAGSGGMGEDHPIAWCQYYNGGRSWYTGGGHTSESYTEPAFVDHLTGGILWAAGLAEDDCGGTVDDNFQKIVLDDDVASPMGLQVADDGRVFFIERAGEVQVIDPQTSTTATIGELPVHTGQENGLLGIELDPEFTTNGWIYLYYTPDGDLVEEPHQRLSRFTLTDGGLDMDSEQVLLRVPHQRETCCHSGGHLEFGPDGNLWISTGDDTSPSASDGYTPIDERDGRTAYDAQRSSANTNDLRGKLLRISPTDDGSYTVPQGNLVDTDWAAGTDQSLIRPEIYGMGFRNPFRFSVDPATGAVHLADYGPDANEADPDRGSDGRVEWNRITRPGNYGWPYCHGSAAFVDYDFATGESGEAFDCAAPTNDSPNNTGLTELPPVIEPTVWYGRSAAHPVIGTGGAPMGGPAYQFDETLDSDRQWPDSFDGTPIFYEWGQDDLYEFHVDDAGTVQDITPLLTSMDFTRPHDMTFGPQDGAMYMIEWGSGFGGDNPDAQVVRIDYTGGQENPIARASASPRSGGVPLTVAFSSAGTAHPQGGDLSYLWEFGDGATSTEPHPSHTYSEEGNFTAVLTVTDVQGRTGTANVTVSVGNTEPEVEITWPAQGTVFSYGDVVDYQVEVVDAEDGTTADGDIDCADVTVDLILGHNDHGHDMQEQSGCTGSFVLEEDGGHVDTDRITYALEARYTDHGSPEGTVDPLVGRDVHAMQPSRKQAEHYDPDGDVRTEDTQDPLGGDRNVGWIEDGNSLTFSDFNFANVDGMRFRVASPNDSSRIEVRRNSVDGELLGVAAVPETGGFQSWDWAEASVDDPGGTFDLVLVFRGGGGYLLNLNWMDFVGEGAAGGPPVDVPEPTAALDPAAPDGSDGWYVSPVTLTVATEADDALEYRIGASGDWLDYDGPVTIADDGTHHVEYRAVRGEDTSRRGRLDVLLDQDAPATTPDLRAEVVDGAFTGTVEVALGPEDATSGVSSTEYRLDDGPATAYGEAFTVTGAGQHTVEYRSTDVAGNVEDWQSTTFVAPSGPQPEVTLAAPSVGGVVPFGRAVAYEVDVDADHEVDCADVRTRLVVTHGDHVHEGDPSSGCDGLVAMIRPADAGDADRLTFHLEATYVEGGFDGDVVDLAEASARVRLQPERVEAEHHDPDADVRTEETGDDIGGGRNVGWIQDGFTVSYSDVDLAGIDRLRFRLAGMADDGVLEVRNGAVDGTLLGTVDIDSTGGSQSYEWFSTEVTDPGGPVTLVLVFRNDSGGYIANFNLFEFVGDGVAAAPPTVEATLPGEPDGDDGWWVTPPTVTVEASDPHAAVEVDLGDGWVDYTGPVTVDTDGQHVVRSRASSLAGTSEVGELDVRVDTTGPSIEVEGIADGDEIAASTSLEVSASVADATSGPAGVHVLVDGQTVATGDTEAGATLDGLDWALGEHTLAVQGRDEAGNTVTSERSFTITTSGEDVLAILDDLQADGAIDRRTRQQVGQQVEVALRLADKGRTEPAVEAYGRARDRASAIEDATVRGLLVAHLDTILDELG